MKKPKKSKGKVPERENALNRIAAQLRTALRRETKNIIEIGNLLIESRKHLDHGEWQPWVAENSGLSIRSAQNYCAAAEYVARAKSKSATVADFANLSATVLYALAAGHRYNEQEEAAILTASRERRIDEDAAWAICEALAPPDDAADDDDQEGGGDDTEAAAADDPEIAAILDGPPPAVPPPAPNPPPTDFALRDFDEAISALNQLKTKLPAQFEKKQLIASKFWRASNFSSTP